MASPPACAPRGPSPPLLPFGALSQGLESRTRSRRPLGPGQPEEQPGSAPSPSTAPPLTSPGDNTVWGWQPEPDTGNDRPASASPSQARSEEGQLRGTAGGGPEGAALPGSRASLPPGRGTGEGSTGRLRTTGPQRQGPEFTAPRQRLPPRPVRALGDGAWPAWQPRSSAGRTAPHTGRAAARRCWGRGGRPVTGLAWLRPSLADGADCTPVSQGNRDTATGQEGQLGGAGQAGRRGETTRRSEELTQPGAAAGPAWQGPSRLARSVSVPVPLHPRRLQVKDTGPAPLHARCALCSEGPNPSPAPPPSSPREALPGLAPRLPARRPVSLFSRPPKAASVLASSVCSLGCWGPRQAGPGAPCPAQHLRLLTFSARQLAGGPEDTVPCSQATPRRTALPSPQDLASACQWTRPNQTPVHVGTAPARRGRCPQARGAWRAGWG